MAFRTRLLAPARGAMRSSRGMATATGPAVAEGGGKKKAWGDYVPVYVAVGMIALSAGLGAHLVKQQLMHAPGVTVKKSRRTDTLPELAEPERAVNNSDNFIKKSFFRKVAHVQEEAESGDVEGRRSRSPSEAAIQAKTSSQEAFFPDKGSGENMCLDERFR
ncbi:hypothetical protein V2J09_011497 [Rumex salicifolius]